MKKMTKLIKHITACCLIAGLYAPFAVNDSFAQCTPFTMNSVTLSSDVGCATSTYDFDQKSAMGAPDFEVSAGNLCTIDFPAGTNATTATIAGSTCDGTPIVGPWVTQTATQLEFNVPAFISDATAFLIVIANVTNGDGLTANCSVTMVNDLGGGATNCESNYAFTTTACAGCSEPSAAPANPTFSGIGETSFTINWSAGGPNYLVVMKSGSAVTSVPVDGTNYTASTTFGSGDDIGTSEFVVYDGTGTSVAVTGLTCATTYHVAIFSYDCSPKDYKTDASGTGNQATSGCPGTCCDATLNQDETGVDCGGATCPPCGVSNLSAGDISIIGLNSVTPDEFTFVALVNIAVSEEIRFTDNGWLASGSFRAGEGYLTWTAPGGGITCGTEVTITNNAPWSATSGTVVTSGGTFNLSIAGDQILAFQGYVDCPTHIFALNDEGAGIWQADATSSNTSALPTGLTNGTNAVAINEIDNNKYNCSVNSGTQTDLLTAICNNTNWGPGNNSPSTITLPPACSFTCGAGCSEPVTPASSITFTCKTLTSMNVSWTNGDGANRIVVVSASPITASEEPVDGTTYTANTVYGSGTAIGSGFVVYNSTGNSVTVTGLLSATTYYFAVFEYDCSPENYLTSSYPTTSTATLTNNVVFINEIHYDNSGIDAGEGVEIAGPAGTDLSCYDVVFYNGAGGAVYSTLTLSGTIDNEGCGYGAVWFAQAAIQNGAPDGMALVNTNGCVGPCDNDDVVQFLSYEGSFTATDGPANGMTSTDIGVDQEPAPAAGNTIQLLGGGTIYSDFYWEDPTASSLGTINTGQDFCPATQLTFTSIPISCRAVGQTFSVTVCATNASGVVYNSYTGSITVSKATGPGTLSGTLVKAATSGCATFADLSFDAAGAYTLSATDGSLSGTSGSFTISAACSGAGIIINEFSNGPAGSQEYVELLVVGTSCTNADIRGFIVDDNNGDCNDGFSTKQKESGVALGYIEFDAIARWASVPVGSIILIYNNSDKNPAITQADDPDDTGTPDFVYILPANDAGLIGCSTTPHTSGSGSSRCEYSPCTMGASSWSTMTMRNAGDAIQVRNPDETYFHGISYGDNATYNMTGGPDDLNVLPSSGAGKVFYFNNADYRAVGNFTEANVAGNETPGAANNAANTTYINNLRACGTCADGIQNQGESAVDCGAPCPACSTCADGIQNGFETGVDCGGPDCAACAGGCP